MAEPTRIRKQVDELTQEKFGEHAGKRSLKRTAALFGLSLLLILFLQAELLYIGILLDVQKWSDFKGWYMWTGGFAGSTLVPYIVSHFRR